VVDTLGSSLRRGQTAAAAPSLRTFDLTLLRGFSLERSGCQVALPLGTQRLVAFLAVHRRPLERLFVAGSLWLDRSEEHANASLRTALWRLRRLGLPLIVSTRSRLMLAPTVTVDLHELTSRAEQVLRREGTIELAPLDRLLFDGDVLTDWYEDWVLLERERFRQLRLHALEALCEDLTSARSYAAAVEAGLACVAAEPLRESGHRALIKAHLAEGNPGEAIRQYELFRRLVLEPLGVESSDEMRRVVASLPVG
jgi:DNA-binding SARP family transcriptional activator